MNEYLIANLKSVGEHAPMEWQRTAARQAVHTVNGYAKTTRDLSHTCAELRSDIAGLDMEIDKARDKHAILIDERDTLIDERDAAQESERYWENKCEGMRKNRDSLAAAAAAATARPEDHALELANMKIASLQYQLVEANKQERYANADAATIARLQCREKDNADVITRLQTKLDDERQELSRTRTVATGRYTNLTRTIKERDEARELATRFAVKLDEIREDAKDIVANVSEDIRENSDDSEFPHNVEHWFG